jgi:hypothetical protein
MKLSLQMFPLILANASPIFDFSQCKFDVEACKGSTARVVVWRDLGITFSYTCESSFCGSNQGPLKGYQYTPTLLADMGHSFCSALVPFGKLAENEQSILKTCTMLHESLVMEKSNVGKNQKDRRCSQPELRKVRPVLSDDKDNDDDAPGGDDDAAIDSDDENGDGEEPQGAEDLDDDGEVTLG